jgi:hypothetical protein
MANDLFFYFRVIPWDTKLADQFGAGLKDAYMTPSPAPKTGDIPRNGLTAPVPKDLPPPSDDEDPVGSSRRPV